MCRGHLERVGFVTLHTNSTGQHTDNILAGPRASKYYLWRVDLDGYHRRARVQLPAYYPEIDLKIACFGVIDPITTKFHKMSLRHDICYIRRGD